MRYMSHCPMLPLSALGWAGKPAARHATSVPSYARTCMPPDTHGVVHDNDAEAQAGREQGAAQPLLDGDGRRDALRARHHSQITDGRELFTRGVHCDAVAARIRRMQMVAAPKHINSRLYEPALRATGTQMASTHRAQGRV